MHLLRTAAALILSGAFPLAHAADLSIRIDEVRDAGGQMMLALYDTEDSFLKRPVRTAMAPASAGSTALTITGLAPGQYAFAVYHDANGNGKMDRNALGIPSEDYAFSNNALGNMGPPAFATARFSVPAEGAEVRVSLR